MKGSGAKYRALFNTVRDGIVLIDWETDEIVDCNPEFENQSGRDLRQPQKIRIWEIGPGEKVEEARRTFFEIRDDGVGGSAKSEFEKPDGEIIEIEFLAKPVTVEGKQYLQSISRDVTKHKRMKKRLFKQNEFMNNVLEALTYPFNVIDVNDYSIKRANSASDAGLLTGTSKCYAITHRRNEPCDGPDHRCPPEEVKSSKKHVVVEHDLSRTVPDIRYP